MDKNGTIYTTVFSFVTTAIFVGALALVNGGLKSEIDNNILRAERSSILSALGIEHDRNSLEDINPKYESIDIRYYQKVSEGQYQDISSEIDSPEDWNARLTFSVDPTEYEVLYYVNQPGSEGLIAKRFTGAGLWGQIEGVLTVNSSVTRTRGLEIISHNETPGLGARITEDPFKNQLNDEAIVGAAGVQVLKPKEGASADEVDRDDGVIDAITGATRTSDAMSDIFRKSISVLRAIEGESNE
jgi:Na+-transporting NADH:ubiquinone oxidoreductase subunit C